jgi:hypothetical protein
MVFARSRDAGRSFGAAVLVHADGWALAACPHRGGALAFGADGRALAAWYTEGPRAEPALQLAAARDGAGFGPPRALHAEPGSLPDRVTLALRGDGAGVVAWEAATPVRSEIRARALAANGDRVGPALALSQAMKAQAPVALATRDGRLLVAWNEEEFPVLRTVVQALALRGDAEGDAAP